MSSLSGGVVVTSVSSFFLVTIERNSDFDSFTGLLFIIFCNGGVRDVLRSRSLSVDVDKDDDDVDVVPSVRGE